MTLERWRRISDWPLAAASLVFLGFYAWTVIGNLHSPDDRLAELVMTVVWVLFVVDYGVSLFLAPQRGRWFVTHLHELVIVVFPVLRPLRLLRLVKFVSVLHRTAGAVFRGRVTIYLVASATLLIVTAALAILDAEQNASGSNITSFGDALWWAFVTITTVGYGDHYPVTVLGRMIAAGLMIAGVALVGSVTATLASWFVETLSRSANMQRAAEGQLTEEARSS